MNNKGYSQGNSNELNAGRSGFSASGNYRTPFKLEPLLTGIFFGLCGTVALLLILFVWQFAKKNLKGGPEDDLLLVAAVVILAVVEALVVVVAIVLVKIVRSGYVCSYTADNNRFITNEGGNIRTIYFDEVQSVNFFPKTIFGKVRGYDVNVRLNGYDERYSIVSEGFLSEKTTPFYIIVERVEKKRREAVRERYEAERVKLGSNGAQPSPQPEIGRSAPSSRLGQDAVMPSVSLSAMTTAAVTVKSDERNETYVGSDGREQLYNEVISTGRFKVVCGVKKTVVLALIAAVAIPLFNILSAPFYNGSIPMAIICFLIQLIGIAAAVIMVIIFFIGDECTYRANGHEFVVTDKKGGETHIAYENAQGVHYFNTLLGYKVEILTIYGLITYNCVDKRRRIFEKPEKLPFNIIAKNIKK